MTLAVRLRDSMAPTMPAILGLRSPAARRWLPVAVPGLAMLGLGLFEATRPVLSWDEIAISNGTRCRRALTGHSFGREIVFRS